MSDLEEARHHHSGVRDEWGPGAVLVQEAPGRRTRQPCNHGQAMEAGARCESHSCGLSRAHALRKATADTRAMSSRRIHGIEGVDLFTGHVPNRRPPLPHVSPWGNDRAHEEFQM